MLSHKIDVIIPTHNSEKYLQATINSILTNPELRILIVDDHSTDRTRTIIEQNGLAYIESKGKGAFEARRVGLQGSQSEFVLFMDSDDLLEEGWRKGLEQLVSNTQLIGIGGRTRNFGPCHKSTTKQREILEGTSQLIQRTYGPWPISGSVWVRKKLLETFELMPIPLSLSFADDYELLIRGSLNGFIGTIEEIMVSYRIADGKSQKNPRASLGAALEIARYYNHQLNLDLTLSNSKQVDILTSRRRIQIQLYNKGKFRTVLFLITSPTCSFHFLRHMFYTQTNKIKNAILNKYSIDS